MNKFSIGSIYKGSSEPTQKKKKKKFIKKNLMYSRNMYTSRIFLDPAAYCDRFSAKAKYTRPSRTCVYWPQAALINWCRDLLTPTVLFTASS